MRIAFDLRSLSEGQVSGVAAYTRNLFLALQQGQADVTGFYNAWKRKPELPAGAPVKAWQFPNKIFNASQRLFGYPQWNNLVDADIYFAPNLNQLPLKPGSPLVVVAHDLSFEMFPEFYSARHRLWHRLMQPRELMQKADAVIAVSQNTKNDIIDLYGIDHEKIHVVHSGIDAAGLAAAEEEKPARPYILYLGTLEPRKNVTSLVKAFSAIAEKIPHDLVLAGAEGWLTQELNHAIAASPVRNRIKKIGPVSEEKKWRLYKNADLFVYPSFYEGFGFPPLEALLAGTPVVTSYNSAIPEIAGEFVAGAGALVNPYDTDELALVMQELLKNPPQVPENTRQAIRAKYNWHNTAHEITAVLSSVS